MTPPGDVDVEPEELVVVDRVRPGPPRRSCRANAPDDAFAIGGSKVVRSSPVDSVTLIGAGITLHEAITASDSLEADGIAARVIDLYSIKPI